MLLKKKTIQAIFLEDFVLVNSCSNNGEEWSPPEFVLLLKPQQGLSQDEVYATVNLHIKFCSKYPKVQPCIVQLENSHGVSLKDVAQLQSELEQLCKNNEGEEIVFLLAHLTQTFLAERNQKPRFRSFHEEMLATEKNKIEKVALEEKSRQVKEDEEQFHAFREELQKRQPALLSELRRNKTLDVSQHPLLEINFAPSARNNGERDHRDRADDYTAPDVSSSTEKVRQLCLHRKIQHIVFSNKDGGRIYHLGPCMGVCQEGRYICSAVEANVKESAAVTILKVFRLVFTAIKTILLK